MFSHIAQALQLGLILRRSFLSSQLGRDIWLLEKELSLDAALLVQDTTLHQSLERLPCSAS